MNNDISTIENKLIETVTGLNLLKRVFSAGREALPKTLTYPSAYVFFVEDKKLQSRPRPVRGALFRAVVVNKNLSSEKTAALDTYAIITSIFDAIEGKALTVDNIETFECGDIQLTGYDAEAGEISYEMDIYTVRYLPVPAG